MRISSRQRKLPKNQFLLSYKWKTEKDLARYKIREAHFLKTEKNPEKHPEN